MSSPRPGVDAQVSQPAHSMLLCSALVRGAPPWQQLRSDDHTTSCSNHRQEHTTYKPIAPTHTLKAYKVWMDACQCLALPAACLRGCCVVYCIKPARQKQKPFLTTSFLTLDAHRSCTRRASTTPMSSGGSRRTSTCT